MSLCMFFCQRISYFFLLAGSCRAARCCLDYYQMFVGRAFALPESFFIIFFFRGRLYDRPIVGVDTVVKAVAVAASP